MNNIQQNFISQTKWDVNAVARLQQYRIEGKIINNLKMFEAIHTNIQYSNMCC